MCEIQGSISKLKTNKIQMIEAKIRGNSYFTFKSKKLYFSIRYCPQSSLQKIGYGKIYFHKKRITCFQNRDLN